MVTATKSYDEAEKIARELREEARESGDYKPLIAKIEEIDAMEKAHPARWFAVRAGMMTAVKAAAAPTWGEKIDAAREAVEEADAAFYADPDDDAKRKAYEAAKKDYRAIERAAFADGFYWTCGRCGGSGRWVNGGVCFNCGGTGFHPNQNPHKFQASPRVRHKREAEHRAKLAAEDAAFDESLRKIGGEVEARLREAVAKYERLGGYYHESGEEFTKDETFAHSLAEKLRKYGSLSEKQVAAVQRGIDREKERAAEQEALGDAPKLVEGRRLIEGEIVSTRDPDPDAQYPALKMLLREDDGNKVWGTVPRALEELTFPIQSEEDGTWQDAELAELKGARVRFTATVERSNKDEHFGFFTRPTKAGLVRAPEEAR